jgi:pyruvate formate lyase activating enzyme
VTAGYAKPDARRELFAHVDAANVDLKGFSERFYHKLCSGHLGPVLDTLRYLKHETPVWLEITTLLIPGENDSDAELHEASAWVAAELGPDVPWHFTAFHPDFRMRDKPPTPAATLRRARAIAREHGLHFVYTGNVHDPEGQSTACPGCGALLIGRDGYTITSWDLDRAGRCPRCATALPGVFEPRPGSWGPRRRPVRLAELGARE